MIARARALHVSDRIYTVDRIHLTGAHRSCGRLSAGSICGIARNGAPIDSYCSSEGDLDDDDDDDDDTRCI